MVIGAGEPEFARSGGLAKDRPVLVVPVLVGDPCVQDQVSGEHLDSGELVRPGWRFALPQCLENHSRRATAQALRDVLMAGAARRSHRG